MDITVTPLAATDRAAIQRALDVVSASEAYEIPDFPPMCPLHFFGTFAHPWPGERLFHALAEVDGETVGYVEVMTPSLENLDQAYVRLEVLPAHRRRGVGRALVEWAQQTAREQGRTQLVGFSPEALPGGEPRPATGVPFADAMGAKNALTEVRRRLDTTALDQAGLDRLLAEAWVKAEGYSLVRWVGPAPEEYVADAAYLDGRLLSDAPTGDLALEGMKMDVERYRGNEAARAARGRRNYVTAARHDETDKLVAITALDFSGTVPWHAFQGITLVDPEHRGHRLGAIVKIENLRYAMASESELRMVNTWNAAVNAHMISINESIGFRPADQWHNWQLTL